MEELLNYLGFGGGVAVILGIFVEFSPIPFNPVQILGNRFNKDIRNAVKEMREELSNHIVDDWRTYILNFQNECLNHRKHTKEEFTRAYNICDKYETYIKKNDITNGEVIEAIEYIRHVYRTCLENGDFLLKNDNV